MSPPARTPTFPQVLIGAIEGALRERVHTQMPGRIESFDVENNVADVQPCVDQLLPQEDGSILVQRFAVLRNVPVVFPGGGGYRITFPVKAGDYCELSFQESSIDAWRSNGGVVDPKDGRRFHLGDALCHVGVQPNAQPWTGVSITAATFGKDGGPQVVARENHLELGSDADNPPTDWMALASLVKTEIGKVRDNLNDLVTTFNQLVNTMTANNVLITAHKHPVSGAAATPDLSLAALAPGSSATAPGAVSDVKSDKVKSL